MRHLAFRIFAERVKPAMNVPEVFICYMSVDLGSDNIFVAEEFLDGS